MIQCSNRQPKRNMEYRHTWAMCCPEGPSLLGTVPGFLPHSRSSRRDQSIPLAAFAGTRHSAPENAGLRHYIAQRTDGVVQAWICSTHHAMGHGWPWMHQLRLLSRSVGPSGGCSDWQLSGHLPWQKIETPLPIFLPSLASEPSRRVDRRSTGQMGSLG